MSSAGESYWNATASATAFPQLAGDVEVDVAIVGGGIVGATAARALKDAGLTVAVVEALRVGRQVTGKSTAKITSQHNLIYQKLEKAFGRSDARLYAQAQEAGLRKIQALVEQYGIDCSLEPKSAFAYATNTDSVEQIEKELDFALEFGLPAALARETDLPFEVAAALRFDNQAQFHPTRYIAGLVGTIPGEGSHVFEESRVIEWEPQRIRTERGSVRAQHVVLATHLPLGQIGGYYAMAHPHAKPVIAAKVQCAPNGMFISVDRPTRSIRTHRADGATYAIAVGDSFKPGHSEAEREAFEGLESWLEDNFDAGPIEYRWINEDYTSVDGAPFIGWSSSTQKDAFLVATGFNAWGITNGTVAGMIIADLAQGQKSEWSTLFDATRIKPIAGAPLFVKENLGIAKHLIGGYLSGKPESFERLAKGEAAILRINGKDVAAFRDETGKVHAISAACTHMGCLLGWNATDRTWDCHCHGSRFDLGGNVIHGPAVAGATRLRAPGASPPTHLLWPMHRRARGQATGAHPAKTAS